MHEIKLQEFLSLEHNPAVKAHALLLSDVTQVHFLEDHGILRFCSENLNSLVDGYDVQKSLDGFNDKPVIAWTFIRLPDGSKAYSFPACFVIGRSRPDGYGYTVEAKGFEEMAQAHIPEAIKQRIMIYLLNHSGI